MSAKESAMLGFKVLMVDDHSEFGRELWKIKSWFGVGGPSAYNAWPMNEWFVGKCLCVNHATCKFIVPSHVPFPPDRLEQTFELLKGNCGLYTVNTFDLAWQWVGIIHTNHIISTAEDRVLKKDIGIFLVECAGRVVIHEQGARAEMARIVAPILDYVDPRLVDHLESEYGVLAIGKDDADIAIKYSREEALV